MGKDTQIHRRMNYRPALKQIKPRTARREAARAATVPPECYPVLFLIGAFLYVTRYTRTEPDYQQRTDAAHLLNLIDNPPTRPA